MSELQERFQRWADELVDLTARNELINFKVTKTSTMLPDPKGLSKLLNGDTVAISDLCDLTDPDQIKPAKGAIKTAIEFKELPPIEWTWDKFKGKCKAPIRQSGKQLWTKQGVLAHAVFFCLPSADALRCYGFDQTCRDVRACPPVQLISGRVAAAQSLHRREP